MSGRTGAETRTTTVTTLGLLTAIRFAAHNPTRNGRTVTDTLALISRLASEAIDRKELP